MSKTKKNPNVVNYVEYMYTVFEDIVQAALELRELTLYKQKKKKKEKRKQMNDENENW